jgi:hypothetical protein
MPGTEADANQNDQTQDVADKLRSSVADAYAFVQGQETTEAFTAITFEECLDKQIESIEGAGTQLRPNILDRIRRVKENILAAVEEIKGLPDDYFKQHDNSQDAVTDPEVDE